jgi:hypothetical protein
LTENKNWVVSDFQKYIYPYLDIYSIENSKYGKDFYLPTLVEIIPTEKINQKILKIAFIGHNNETKENQLKSIYNLVANIQQDKVLFSRYLDFSTEKWKTFSSESMTYIVSPNKIINATEIDEQKKDIDKITDFLGIDDSVKYDFELIQKMSYRFYQDNKLFNLLSAAEISALANIDWE